MNAQQSRIEDILDELPDDEAVDLVTMTDLLAEGFDLRCLD